MVAALTGALATSLVAGSAILTVFGVHSHHLAVLAEQRAQAERAERERAEDAEKRLEKEQDNLEREFALGLLSPLDRTDAEKLSQPELEALWRLASTTNERVRLRFLEEALRTETTASQLRNRAALCVHAAVGLDSQQRARAEQLFAQAMRDADTSLRDRVEFVWAILEVSEQGSPLQQECLEVVGRGWAFEKNANVRKAWLSSLSARVDRFAPSAAARFLNQLLAQNNDVDVRFQLAATLAEVAERMKPAEAARVGAEAARLLGQALAEDKVGNNRRQLAAGLAAVSRCMEPAEADRVCADAARSLIQELTKKKDARDRFQLAATLAEVAERMEPAEAAGVCAAAARLLGRTLAEDKFGESRRQLAAGLAAVAKRMEPAEAARLCAEAARSLVQALTQATDVEGWLQVIKGLAAVSERMEPAEAARVCAEATRSLIQALTEEKDLYKRMRLAENLSEMAKCLKPAEAAQLLCHAMTKEKDGYLRRQLAFGLMTVIRRMESAEAMRLLNQALAKEDNGRIREDFAICLREVTRRVESVEEVRARAAEARLLSDALTQEKDSFSRVLLASAVAEVAERLEPAEAAHLCSEAARSYIQSLNHEVDRNDAEAMSSLMQCLDGEESARAACIFTLRMVSDPDRFCFIFSPLGEDAKTFDPTALERFCVNATQPQLRRRAVAIAAAIGISTRGPALALTFLPTAAEPLPCRFTTQHLVDLLKMPTCVGEVRRVILDQLGNRYRHRFDTHWDFVRYAQEHTLNLDFTTPPQRPGRKLPPLFER